MSMDISTFVKNKLSRSNIPLNNQEAIIQAVPSQADGLFLYAKLTIEAFLKPSSNVNTVLTQLPTTLNDLYASLLAEHAKRSKIALEVQDLILRSVIHNY